MMLGKKRPFRELEKKIGYRFRDQELLDMALTHRSFRFENHETRYDNQRLEFLGDAVLGFLAAAELYKDNPSKEEGYLTSARSKVTSGRAFAQMASELGIGDHLKLGKGELKSGGRERESNLADAFESLLGACYLDGGIPAARRVFDRIIAPRLADEDRDRWADNPKGALQEQCQRKYKQSPSYRVIATDGPGHARRFTVEVALGDKVRGVGRGNSKQEAEINAAMDALKGKRID
ncbi:MAG: ribonuclease III [Kiritimatiellia bacterium]|jgi:ribonuclease-3|nr:ribonuclease III [Kiritimatiellia bacterium]MDP6811397.1 ribonuclease III [Kiritimatiellia bacterium]MDP7023807.1 ribonuclease III [Kiritimatiellia bacterium]